MPILADVAEHWTDSGTAVVLTADSAVIDELVVRLGLSTDSPVSVKSRQRALALWGEDLASYLQLRSGWMPKPSSLHRAS